MLSRDMGDIKENQIGLLKNENYNVKNKNYTGQD